MLNRTSTALRRVAAVALPLAVATSLVSSGIAAADVATDQGKIAAGLSSAGVENGVGFRTTVSPDLRQISASVEDGTFVIAPDATKASVISASGATVSEFPLSLNTVGGNIISIAAVVSEDAKSIQLAPVYSNDSATELKNIATNPNAANHDPIQNGAAAGAGISVLINLVVCLPTLAAFIVGYIACAAIGAITGAVYGAIIGAVVGAVAPDVIPQVLP
ncbi:hypothetical protein ACTWPB_03510 [Nocardia sp. IBHARD005]|uniref:hypothetical protein n=1 Tax=Nocardia sp. IBHARD005 TaxID=3457765 RepID=UPI004059ABC5